MRRPAEKFGSAVSFFEKYSKKILTAGFKKFLLELFPSSGSSLKFTLCD